MAEPTFVDSIRAGDGVTSELRVFPAAHAGAAAPVFLCMPAMGVSASYYDPLATALAARGLHAAVGELRGHGTSSVRPGRGVDFGYADLLMHDWPALVAGVRARFPSSPLYLLGHSLGGHLHTLWAAWRPESVSGLVLVASGSVHFRTFPSGQRLLLLAGTQLAAALASVRGHYPGERVGFGGREARRLIGDWARLGRTGRFAPTGAPVDFEARLAEARVRVLAVSIAGDSFAPVGAVEGLVGKLRRAEVERYHFTPPPERGRWHFQWVRRPDAIADRIASWTRASSAATVRELRAPA